MHRKTCCRCRCPPLRASVHLRYDPRSPGNAPMNVSLEASFNATPSSAASGSAKLFGFAGTPVAGSTQRPTQPSGDLLQRKATESSRAAQHPVPVAGGGRVGTGIHGRRLEVQDTEGCAVRGTQIVRLLLKSVHALLN